MNKEAEKYKEERKKKARRIQMDMEKEGETNADAEEIKLQADGFGLTRHMPDIETPYEVIAELTKSVATEDEELAQSLASPIISPQGRSGKYRIDEQQFALMFLEVFTRTNKITGEEVPRFPMVSKMVGISVSTLRSWWQKREVIETQYNAVVEKGLSYVGTAFMVELMRMTQALATIDYKTYLQDPKDFKNFIGLFNTVTNKVRLFNNRSTQNVEHSHHGGVEMIIPEK